MGNSSDNDSKLPYIYYSSNIENKSHI